MIKRVVLAVSGGVDSAVAAILLKKKGFNVQAVFMKNWDSTDEMGFCQANEDYQDAEYLCSKLGIELHLVNFVKEFWNEVFCDLISEYENGRTPNPDILCNRNIKFNYFYNYAVQNLLADAIATGHYAKTSFGPFLEKYHPQQNVGLYRARDLKKDQTFFLSQISQKALRKTLFPLGDLLKSEVKQIAVENGLEKFALKPESMGICFIGDRNFQTFIKEYISNKPGNFVDIDTGKVVGAHDGLHHWTLGQRCRLSGLSKAYFIARKWPKNNDIYVAQGTTHKSLNTSLFFTEQPHWIRASSVNKKLRNKHILRCNFKFQHTQDLIGCRVCQFETSGQKKLIIILDEKKRALTPGQYAVLYHQDSEECLGGALISGGITDFFLYK